MNESTLSYEDRAELIRWVNAPDLTEGRKKRFLAKTDQIGQVVEEMDLEAPYWFVAADFRFIRHLVEEAESILLN
jgi:hypothetical protein